MIKLSATEGRVVTALVEKDRTTPDSYPLTTNSLVAACNQKTSRDPVTSLTPSDVDAALLELRQRGMVRTVRGTGERTFKHRHTLDEALGLDEHELACLAVLVLRGAQTAGELRTRTDRYTTFDDVGEVDSALRRLAGRDEPLARNVGRGPGQSQDRWLELLTDRDHPPPDPVPSSVQTSTGDPVPSSVQTSTGDPVPSSVQTSTTEWADRSEPGLEALRAEVRELRAMMEELRAELGLDPAGPARDAS